jgi:hypothetical protein
LVRVVVRRKEEDEGLGAGLKGIEVVEEEGRG